VWCPFIGSRRRGGDRARRVGGGSGDSILVISKSKRGRRVDGAASS
jgi:hypothetical protein